MKWNKSNRHKLYRVPFSFPAFFPFLLSVPILMSTTAFYLGMVPAWYITGRTHTAERGQDSSRATVMLAERLRVLRQARWVRVWAKDQHHAQGIGRGGLHTSPWEENVMRALKCGTLCVCVRIWRFSHKWGVDSRTQSGWLKVKVQMRPTKTNTTVHRGRNTEFKCHHCIKYI